jgi:hypothetical protein
VGRGLGDEEHPLAASVVPLPRVLARVVWHAVTTGSAARQNSRAEPTSRPTIPPPGSKCRAESPEPSARHAADTDEPSRS